MLTYFDEDIINLDKYSFEQWVTFVFDHHAVEWQPPKRGIPREKKWYYEDEWEHWGSPEHLLPYMTRLFRKPDFLLEKYSAAQLFQGFWYLSGAGRCDDWIWETKIAWRLRKNCISSMVPLYERMFIKEPLGFTCNMWWDCINNFRSKQDPKVKEMMLLAMERILLLPSKDCWGAALHGLGHLKHPRKAKVIRKFLHNHPELNEEWQAYATAAITGKIL